MTTEIYYFSATGNSYWVASILSKKLNAQMIPLASLQDNKTIQSAADVIGFVFPIYDFKAPPLLTEFLTKLHTTADTYFFAVCTYGVMPLNTMKKLQHAFQQRNTTLHGGFTIHMPHNGLGARVLPKEQQQQMYDQFLEKAQKIQTYVQQKHTGTIEKSTHLDRLRLLFFFLRALPLMLRLLLQAAFKGWKSLGFSANKHCISCGLCTEICPVENITLQNKKPIWKDHCINCFACIHWCPQQAIHIAKLTQHMPQYHHPKVQKDDIIKQKTKK